MRKIIIAVSCCLALLLLGYFGYRAYQVSKEKRWTSLAKKFQEQGDTRNELLCLQQLLNLNRNNLSACNRMAVLAEAARSPAAVFWREQVLQLDPDSLTNRLALAQTAFLMGDIMVATNTLDGVNDAGKKTAAYHNLAGVIASGLKNPFEAERHFAEATRLDPNDPAPQLNLAVIRLQSTNPLHVAEAKISLQRISNTSTNTSLRLEAKRALVRDAIRTNQKALTLQYARELADQTSGVFADKLLLLEVLQEQKDKDFAPTLARYKLEATNNPANLSQFSIWLVKQTSASQALSWLQSLPREMQTNQPPALIIADCLATLGNWQTLDATLKQQDWQEMDFMRRAYLARSMRAQNMTAASSAEWDVALKQAEDQKSTLITLFKMAASWKWENEAEQILWVIVNRYPEEKWAGSLLKTTLVFNGRTTPLLQYLNLQAKRTPHDLEVLNDLAMTGMLLEAQEMAPFDLAGKVYNEAPTNVAFASTYAFSLYLQKQYSAALSVMQRLKPKELEDPAVAGYYGLILKSTGNIPQGNAYLSNALNQAVGLLPEERKIFEKAWANK